MRARPKPPPRLLRIAALAALAVSLVPVIAFVSPPTAEPISVRDALDLALDDERQAEAFYQAVINTHGSRRPFSNIIEAERRHQAALLAQYERLDLDPPPNRWSDHPFDVPPTFAEACDLAIVSEVRNARLYDDLLAAASHDPQLRAVFESLRDASQERHLPAFKRHSNGWTDVGERSPAQRAQFQRAEAARTDMFARLMRRLTSAMADAGPSTAIRVCAVEAPQIAADVAKEHNVAIGRTSWKLRNPDNLPPTWAMLLVDEKPEQQRVLTARDGRLGVLSPIRVASTCLQCHGTPDVIAPETLTQLERLYPDDTARGFREGDLRGWFWVEAPPAPAPPPVDD